MVDVFPIIRCNIALRIEPYMFADRRSRHIHSPYVKSLGHTSSVSGWGGASFDSSDCRIVICKPHSLVCTLEAARMVILAAIFANNPHGSLDCVPKPVASVHELASLSRILSQSTLEIGKDSS